MQTVSFLRFRVSAAGIQPDLAKIETIRILSLPLCSRMDTQRFLGLDSQYRSFIPGFANIAAPLMDLLKNEKQIPSGGV